MGVHTLVFLVGVFNVECLGKAVPEVVGGTCLQRLAVMHQRLNGVGCNGTGKLVAFGLSALDDGHRQGVLTEISVHVQHPLGFLNGLLCGGMNGMPLLPQELSGAEEGTGGLFPPYHADPLVVQLGQIPVGVYDVGIMLTEQGLGGRPHTEPILQLFAAPHGDPCHLGRKALHMILLLLQQAFRNEHGHAHVLVAGCLEHAVQNMLNVLPDRICVGPDHHTALDAGVFNQLRLFYNIRVPLCKILVHACDGLHQLFILRHCLSAPHFPSDFCPWAGLPRKRP